ncbi:magnesium transporter NIPA-domain-containing protein [Xylariomycetidae sp. FL2044]|nr:magnesium transporter NIPA-domain-containing protein [Xylariomycetidae sp. FL2044]
MGTLGGLSPGATLAIGIIVGLISTSVQSLGLTLQRKSHMLEDEKGPHETQRPPYRRRRWQLGMGMFVISNVAGSTIQISTLPLPVLSTLQAAGLVFNSICATLILGEPFTKWSFWGTALVAGGAALIAIFGAIPSPNHNLRELLDLLARWPFILWMSLQAVLVIGIGLTVDLVNRVGKISQNPKFRLTRGLAYGCISGILSAHSLLFAKSGVELILRTIADGDNQFVHWQSWMLVLGLVALALSQLYYLHRGLKLVSTSVLYPLVFCIYNIIAILDGLIYFRQTDLITPLHGGLIALGTVVLLSGVLALSWRLSDEQHPPAVGQSTLTPGLGLVEDTEGEEESLIDSDSASEGEGRIPSTYNTFAPHGDVPPSLSSSRQPSSRWAERSQIWGELEDEDTPRPMFKRQRSSTMPGTAATESTSLLDRRLVSGESTASLGTTGTGEENPRRIFRKRRKSTGFPGFTARKTSRRKSSSAGVQDALGGIWKMKWWRNKRGDSSDIAVASPPGSARRPYSGDSARYRDDPEGAGGEGRGSIDRDMRSPTRPPPRGDDAV